AAAAATRRAGAATLLGPPSRFAELERGQVGPRPSCEAQELATNRASGEAHGLKVMLRGEARPTLPRSRARKAWSPPRSVDSSGVVSAGATAHPQAALRSAARSRAAPRSRARSFC